MKTRIIGTIVCLSVLVFSCNKFIKSPPISSTEPSLPQTPSSYERPEYIVELERELEQVPDIVQKLQIIYERASGFHSEGNILAARQIFEEGVDLIFAYEENEENVKYPEYLRLKDKILSDFQVILRKEGFEINETSTNILQQEIDILKGIIETERENEPAMVVPMPTDPTVSPIPQIINSRIQRWVSRFAYGDQRVHFEKWVERSGKYVPMIKQVLRDQGIPEDLAFLAMIESGYNPTVMSSARAVGMWQFMSATGKQNGLKIDGYIDERRDPIKATKAAAKHLKDLYFYWGKDWYLALASYNVSERRLRQAIRRFNTYDFWKLQWPLPQQTRNFVPKFLAAVEIMNNLGKYGFSQPVTSTLEFEEVTINRQASLDVIAKAAGVRESVVRELNTELIVSITPKIDSSNPEYTLRLPSGTKDKFIVNIAAVPAENLISKISHRVRRGETISEIAEMYRVSQSQLMTVNNIRNVRRLQINQELIIPRPSGGFTASYVERSVAATVDRPSVPRDAERRRKITYTVRKNDTLWDIGQEFGVGVNNLRAWNGLSRYGYLYPNQKLSIWLQPSSNISVEPVSRTQNANIGSNARIVHTVRRGDSISRVSQLYGVRVNDIFEWNNLSKSSIIYPGDKIYLYPGTDTNINNTTEGEGFAYTVRRGDNLWDIARRYGTTVNKILNINNKRSSRIYPGDKLVIPASQPNGRSPSL